MERFYGTWKFVSYENFDDYLKGSQCISIIPNPTPRIALVVSWFVHMTHIMYESVRVRYSSIWCACLSLSVGGGMGQREGLSAEAKRPEGLQLEFRRAPTLLVYVMYISSVLEIYSMFPKKKEKMFPALGIPLPLRKVAIFLSPTITISKESDGVFLHQHFQDPNHHCINHNHHHGKFKKLKWDENVIHSFWEVK